MSWEMGEAETLRNTPTTLLATTLMLLHSVAFSESQLVHKIAVALANINKLS
jgi:hypothetical protein